MCVQQRVSLPIILILCFALTIIARPATPAYASPVNEVEPNNSSAQAQHISSIGMYSPIYANIDVAQDVDIYSFDVVAGRRYTVDLYNVASALGATGYRCTDPGMNFGEQGLGLFVYDTGQALVTGRCDAAGRSAGNLHHSESFTAGTTGKYYIKVLTNSYTATGFYSLRILPHYSEPGGMQWDSAYEPNATMRNAYPIQLGYANALTSDIEMRDPRYATYAPDQDVYRFEAVAGMTYVIELFNVAQSLGAEGAICSSPYIWGDRGLFLVLFNPSGIEVAKQCNANSAANSAGNVHHFMEFTASVSGTHGILVKPNNADAAGFYSLRVLPRYNQASAGWNPVDFEPNNSIWNSYAIKPGVDNWLSGQINLRDPAYSTFSADQDWYRLENLAAGQTYEVELFNVIGGLGNNCLTIHNVAKTQVAGSCANGPIGMGTINRRLSFTTPSNGTYHIKIAPNDQSADGMYSLLVCSGSCPTEPPAQPTSPTWLVMLYLGGDNQGSNVESLDAPLRELITRLNGMTYNPDMRLVVLFDGDKPGGGDSRIYLREPDGLTDVTEQAADSPYWLIGMDGMAEAREMDTGSAATLSTFVNWARRSYPGARYTMLSIIDHGGGWAPTTNAPGQPRGGGSVLAGGWRGMSLDLSTQGGNSLSTRDLGQALHDAGHVDLLFLDACLMGMLENAYEVRDYADYLVAGENILFGGLPYQDYLSKNGLTALTTPYDLAQRLVARYNIGTPSQQYPFTISALDLQQLRSVVPGNLGVQLNILAGRISALVPANPTPETALVQALVTIYNQSQKFDYDSSMAIDASDGYVDLVDFVSRLRDTTNPAIPDDVRSAAAAVVNAATGANPVIIANRQRSGSYEGKTWNLSGARGLAIFLPLGEQDYRPTQAHPSDPSQPALAERQMRYYADSTQLMLTRDVPAWAALLVQLEPAIPIIRTGPGGLPGPVGASLSGQLSTQIDTRAFSTPGQVITAVDYKVYLPLITR